MFAPLISTAFLVGRVLATLEQPKEQQQRPECISPSLISCLPGANTFKLNPGSCCASASDGGLTAYTQNWDNESSRWTLGEFKILSCDGTTERRYCDLDRRRSPEGLRDELQNYKGGFSDEWNRLGQIIQTMGWPGQEIGLGLERIWAGMYGEHAPCISTLAPSCTGSEANSIAGFIGSIPRLHERLNTAAFLTSSSIIPTNDTTYALADIQKAVEAGAGEDVRVRVRCEFGKLSDITYTFATEGRYEDGRIAGVPANVPAAKKSNCPKEGIKYVPPSPKPYTDEDVEEAVRALMGDGTFAKDSTVSSSSVEEPTSSVHDEL